MSSTGPFRWRSLAWAIPVLLLVWGTLPYLPGQIDDTYIVFAFARRLAESGEIAWNTGVRVEAYSSALHLGVLALAALAGLDLSIAARALAFVCALGVLGLAARRVNGEGRWGLALFLAGWQPFAYWATPGMETSLAALVGGIAWPLVCGDRRAWGQGVAWTALFSVTRPEGVAWLGLALLRRVVHGRGVGRPEVTAATAVGLLLAYHAARVAYFGYLLPTPYLVKVAAVDAYWDGLSQASRELVSAAPLVVLVVLSRGGRPLWAWLPLLIQASLLVRAGGDWMGHGRFLVPGVVAGALTAWRHGTARPLSRPALGVLAVGFLLAFAWEPSREGQVDGKGVRVPGWRDPWYLQRPMEAVHAPWGVALLEETAFLIERVPSGAGAAISDVGLPGNLDDVRIWDNAGLADRVTAEVIANPERPLVEELKARYRDPDDIWCLRYGWSPDGAETADAWLVELLPEVAPSRSGTATMVWRCRAGGVPDRTIVAARWGRLLARYPSQDWIRWYHARALVALGEVAAAEAEVAGATWMSNEGLGWLLFGETQSTSYHHGRGWALYANGSRTSLSLADAEWDRRVVVLDADDPGEEGAQASLAWLPGCGEPTRVVVHGRTEVAPPPCDSTTARSLVVTFTNDAARPGFDRNLFVTVSD